MRISKRCKERFLYQTTEGLSALHTQTLSWCGISKLYKPYEINRKCPANHVFLYTLAGKGRLDQPGPRQELTPGSVCLLRAGQDHAYGTDSTWDLLWFHPDASEHWNALMPDRAMVLPALWAERLRILAEEFLQETLQRDRMGQLVLLEGYARLIALFLQRELNFSERSGESEHRRRLEHLWHLVSDDPGRDWNTDTLARAGNFSRSNLQLLVHRIYGQGVMEMVAQLRMERAAGLILQRHLKLAEIAESVGYKSPFSFSSAFKRIMGAAPQNYRR